MNEEFENDPMARFRGLGNYASTDELIDAWRSAASDLAVMKEVESDLRKRVEMNVFDPTITEGTETKDLGNGYKLKAAKGWKVTVPSADINLLNQALDKIEKMENGAFIVERLVKWSPTVSKTEYKALNPIMKGIIDDAVTIAPDTTKLTFVEPKAK